MPSLRELRGKATDAKNELLQMKKARVADAVRDAVNDVVESESFNITLMAHKEESVENIATAVANKVVEVCTDPKADFLDKCRSRHMKQSDIRRAVNIMVDAFNLVSEGEDDYEARLQAVAEYFAERPWMYDDVPLFADKSV